VTLGEALALRNWALSALATKRTAPALPPPAGEPAWRIFLQSERCAAVLKSRLTQPHPVLDLFAAREARRVLLARAELGTIASVARAEGLRVVVLKGGVPVADGVDVLDLDDVDVLAEPAHVKTLAAALEGRGYRVHGFRSAHSLRSRVGPGGFPVEIHLSLSYAGEPPAPGLWERIRPLPDGLWVLGPADHAWYVLTHAAVLHPERRGRLRELLQVADALQRCGDAERAEIGRLTQRSPLAGLLQATLALAEAFLGGPLAPDPFPPVAATRLAMVQFFRKRRFPALLEPAIGTYLVRRLVGPKPEPAVARLEESGLSHVAWLERAAPALGRRWRAGLHLLEKSLAAAIGRPLAALLARRSRQGLRAAGVLASGPFGGEIRTAKRLTE
jgi:hypothetical protein